MPSLMKLVARRYGELWYSQTDTYHVHSNVLFYIYTPVWDTFYTPENKKSTQTATFYYSIPGKHRYKQDSSK